MRLPGGTTRKFACLTAALLMLLVGPAASALATTSVRFIHAVPGAGEAQLTAGDSSVVGATGFASASEAAEVEAGSVTLKLSAGDETLAEATEDLEDGQAYTVVALMRGEDGAELRVYRDDTARAGDARLRMIHAAGELGEPDVRAGDRVIAEKLAYKEATPYVSVEPGSYDLAFVRPGGDDALAEERDVALSAGSATTAVVLGSRGEQTRVLVVEDDAVAPRRAPDTGYGGLAGERDDGGGAGWPVVLVAALGAGLLGTLAYGAAGVARRRGHGA